MDSRFKTLAATLTGVRYKTEVEQAGAHCSEILDRLHGRREELIREMDQIANSKQRRA